MRTTQKELTALLNRMRDVSGLNLQLGGAYGGTEVYEELPTGGARSMSGYLPAGQLAAWMRAWLDGYYAAKKSLITPIPARSNTTDATTLQP